MYRDHIRTIYEHLSPGYRRIADFLLTHYQDAAFMTAAEVARAATVDTALVVRFAQRLGYPGYPELIGDIQEDVKRDLRAVYEPPEGDDSPGQILGRNLLQDRNTLEYMRLHLDVETGGHRSQRDPAHFPVVRGRRGQRGLSGRGICLATVEPGGAGACHIRRAGGAGCQEGRDPAG